MSIDLATYAFVIAALLHLLLLLNCIVSIVVMELLLLLIYCLLHFSNIYCFLYYPRFSTLFRTITLHFLLKIFVFCYWITGLFLSRYYSRLLFCIDYLLIVLDLLLISCILILYYLAIIVVISISIQNYFIILFYYVLFCVTACLFNQGRF